MSYQHMLQCAVLKTSGLHTVTETVPLDVRRHVISSDCAPHACLASLVTGVNTTALNTVGVLCSRDVMNV